MARRPSTWRNENPISAPRRLSDNYVDAAPGDHDPGGGAQHVFAEATEAPSLLGRRLHQAPPGMDHFVGEDVEQQHDLVVGEGIERAVALRQASSPGYGGR